jgi:hypothetical protein
LVREEAQDAARRVAAEAAFSVEALRKRDKAIIA